MKIFCPIFLIVICFVSGFGQSKPKPKPSPTTTETATKKPTPDELRMKELQDLIAEADKEAESIEKKLKAYQDVYGEAHPTIREVKRELDSVGMKRYRYMNEISTILRRKFLETLPNNDTELLKIIIRQNQEIIELLRSQRGY